MRNRLLKKLAPCLMMNLISGCAILNQESPIASDSFCSAYQQVIKAKGEGSITAARPVKERIEANEKTFVCLCSNPENKICTK